jgi:hypothetical protein
MMRIRLLVLSFACCLCMVSAAQAQYEWETVYNRRTDRYEQQYNPWNQAQQAYERQQEQLREQHDQNLRDINERYYRAQEERREMTERQREFWRDLMNQQQHRMIEFNTRRNYGLSIITAGKATTTYKPGPAFSLKNYFLQQARTPELRQLVEQYAELCLRQYRDELRARGFGLNDYADGRALIFVICYEAYAGEKPSPAHLAAVRQHARASYLKDPIFQSYNDLERQQRVEPDGALALYARLLAAKGDAASRREARSVAKPILESLWGNNAETILMTRTGFIHKGRQIIADGKATHLYQYDPNLPSAEMMVSQHNRFRADIVREYKQRLALFYQVLAQKGGQKNDLAWCATLAAYAEYYVLTNGQDWTPKQFQSVYQLMKAAILKSPDIQATSEESRQIACEQFAITAVGDYLGFQKPTGRGAAVASARVGLMNLFRALNENPEDYRLTAEGVVRVTSGGK